MTLLTNVVFPLTNNYKELFTTFNLLVTKLKILIVQCFERPIFKPIKSSEYSKKVLTSFTQYRFLHTQSATFKRADKNRVPVNNHLSTLPREAHHFTPQGWNVIPYRAADRIGNYCKESDVN